MDEIRTLGPQTDHGRRRASACRRRLRLSVLRVLRAAFLLALATSGVRSQPVLVTHADHEGAVQALAVSPDARLLATGGADGRVILWEAASGKQVASLESGAGGLLALAFSPDGALLAGGTDGASVVVWEVATGRAQVRLSDFGDAVTALAFNPADNLQLATGDASATLKIWDLASRTANRQFTQLHRNGIGAVAYAPDGTRLASGDRDREVYVLDFSTGTHSENMRMSGGIRTLAFSPDGRSLAAGTGRDRIELWDVDARRRTAEARHSDPVTAAVWIPGTDIVMAGASDGRLGFFDWASDSWLQERAEVFQHRSAVTAVAVSPDGRRAFSATQAGVIQSWTMPEDVQEDPPLLALKRGVLPTPIELNRDAAAFHALAFTDDGRELLVGGSAAGLGIWNLSAGPELRLWTRTNDAPYRFLDTGGAVTAVRTSRPLGTVVVMNGTARTWSRPQPGSSGQPTPGAPPGVRTLAVDGDAVLSLDAGGRAFWSAGGAPPRELAAPDRSGAASAVAVHAGQALAAVGGSDGRVHLWSFEAGQTAPRVLSPGAAGLRALRFSTDGEMLYTADEAGTVKGLHLSSDSVVTFSPKAQTPLHALAVSPDGALLAAGDEAGTVYLWETAGPGRGRTLEGHPGGVTDLSFSPDGVLLASGGADAGVRLWNPQDGAPLTRLFAFGPDSWVAAAPDRRIAGSDGGFERVYYVENNIPVDPAGEAFRTRFAEPLLLTETMFRTYLNVRGVDAVAAAAENALQSAMGRGLEYDGIGSVYRCLIEQGKIGEARQLMDDLLAMPAGEQTQVALDTTFFSVAHDELVFCPGLKEPAQQLFQAWTVFNMGGMDASVLYPLFDLYQLTGGGQLADELVRQVMDVPEEPRAAYLRLVQIYRAYNQPPETMVGVFRNLVSRYGLGELLGQNESVLAATYRDYIARGLTTEADALMRRVSALGSADPERAYDAVADILLEVGRADEAIAVLQRALEANPNNEQARNRLGDAYVVRGEHDRVIDQFKDDPDVGARAVLARAYEAVYMLEEANEAWAEVIRQSTDPREVAEAEARRSANVRLMFDTRTYQARRDSALWKFELRLDAPSDGEVVSSSRTTVSGSVVHPPDALARISVNGQEVPPGRVTGTTLFAVTSFSVELDVALGANPVVVEAVPTEREPVRMERVVYAMPPKASLVDVSRMPAVRDAPAHALLLGVSRYNDPRISGDTFGYQDALLLRDVLTDSLRGGFTPGRVRLLYNRDATRRGMEEALADLRTQVRSSNAFVLVYLGGAVSPDGSGLLPYDAVLGRGDALRASRIDSLLAALPTRRVLVVWDAPLATPEARFPTLLQRGGAVMAAATAGQAPVENFTTEHGIFAYTLFEALDGSTEATVDANADGSLSLAELWAYAERTVTPRAQERGGAQTPLFAGEAFDMKMANNPQGAVEAYLAEQQAQFREWFEANTIDEPTWNEISRMYRALDEHALLRDIPRFGEKWQAMQAALNDRLPPADLPGVFRNEEGP